MLESLIKAGAFDSLGYARRALAEVHERAVEEAVERKKSQALGQYDLFEDIFAGLGGGGATTTDDAPGGGFGFVVREINDWDKTTRLAFEREMLGLYVLRPPPRRHRAPAGPQRRRQPGGTPSRGRGADRGGRRGAGRHGDGRRGGRRQ